MPPEPSPTIDNPNKDTFNLTQLPNELLESIFTFCNLRTFKSLRLVNRRFNQLSTTKEALENFAIKISKPSKIPQLINSTLPFVHCVFDHFNPAELSKNSNLTKNLTKLSKSRPLKSALVVLRTDSNSPSLCSNFHTLLPFLINCAETLESVGILRLTEIKLKFLASLENIKFLRVKKLSIAFDVDVEFVGDELGRCLEFFPSLSRLDLLFPDQEEHPMTLESFTTSVLTQILQYLQKNTQKITINFASECDKVSIPFDFNALEKLLQFPNLHLENVPFLALPTKRILENITKTDENFLQKLNQIKSINANTQDLKISTMEIERDSFHASVRHFIPKSAKFSLTIHLHCGNSLHLTNPVQLLPPVLESICIISENNRASLLRTFDDQIDKKSFIQELLENRPELKELKILSENDKKLDFSFSMQDSVNFKHFSGFKYPNLKILHLNEWKNDFFEIYQLSLLEELVLKNCYQLKDGNIVGVEGNSMIMLKNLKHLTLDGYWSITDISFLQVFSKLPLKKLTVWDDCMDKKNEILTMTSLHSLPNFICDENLELLRINKPFKASLSDVKKSLVKLRSLKRVEVLEGEGKGKESFNSLHF